MGWVNRVDSYFSYEFFLRKQYVFAVWKATQQIT